MKRINISFTDTDSIISKNIYALFNRINFLSKEDINMMNKDICESIRLEKEIITEPYSLVEIKCIKSTFFESSPESKYKEKYTIYFNNLIKTSGIIYIKILKNKKVTFEFAVNECDLHIQFYLYKNIFDKFLLNKILKDNLIIFFSKYQQTLNSISEHRELLKTVLERLENLEKEQYKYYSESGTNNLTEPSPPTEE